MDLGGFVQNAIGGAVGAYAIQNSNDRSPNANVSPENKPDSVTAADSYTPSQSGAVAPDSSDGVRQSAGSGELTSCYCGQCSTCRSRQADSPAENEWRTDQSDLRSGNEQKAGAPAAEESGKKTTDEPQTLSEGEQQQVNELKQRDQEVKAHEQAHASAGGRNVRFDYQTGPDGRQYAVGGTTDIDMSAMSDDYATKIAEARKVRAAALAPASPSSQDMAVAARSARVEMEARAELTKTQQDTVQGNNQGSQVTEASNLATSVNPIQNPFFAVA